MAIHQFDADVASDVGVNAAVLYQNIKFWCEKNAANGKHEYEGRYWTYNSMKAFSSMFPYFTARQIRTALEKLITKGYILSGNFNQSKYDRTTWYSIVQNGQMHLTKKSNGNDKKVKPIPDNKPDNKPDNIYNVCFEELWKLYPHVRGRQSKKDSYKQYQRHGKGLDHETLVRNITELARAVSEGRKPQKYVKGFGRYIKDGDYEIDWSSVNEPAGNDGMSESQRAAIAALHDSGGDWL